MSSAALSRARILAGSNAGNVRPYEIFNYYDFDVPPGPVGSVSLTAEWIDDPLVAGEAILQVHVGAETRSTVGRDPLELTMVLDTSCSMSGTPMALQIDVCNTIASMLDVGDIVNLVTWSATALPLMDNHSITGPNDPNLVTQCDALASGGGTNLSAGLNAGYALAEANWQAGMTNRVMLLSDGGANLGITDADMIAQKAHQVSGMDIHLLGVGVGGIGYNDQLMDTVTDVGRGAAVFIDSTAEAQHIFDHRFMEVMEVAVEDVRLELDLPEHMRILQTSSEIVSTNPAVVRPQHLSANGEMVFYNHVGTPAPACLIDDTIITARVTYNDAAGVAQTVTQDFRVGDMRAASTKNAVKGHAIFRYTEALDATNTGIDLAAAVANARAAITDADGQWPGDGDLAEIRLILEAM
jgi:Ca-activated chloride channel family protein